MSEHPNVARLREGYEAFTKGDLPALDGLFAEDVRWHVPGRGPLAGTYERRAAVYETLGRLMQLTEGSFRIDVRWLLADDEHGAAAVEASAHRGDRTFTVTNAHLFRFAGDRVAEFWETSGDQYAQDALFD